MQPCSKFAVVLFGDMKEKISITLSKSLVAQVDKLAGTKEARSGFIERVLRNYMREQRRTAVDARELEHINRAAVVCIARPLTYWNTSRSIPADALIER
jgi:predicted transcriptional regulator